MGSTRALQVPRLEQAARNGTPRVWSGMRGDPLAWSGRTALRQNLDTTL